MSDTTGTHRIVGVDNSNGKRYDVHVECEKPRWERLRECYREQTRETVLATVKPEKWASTIVRCVSRALLEAGMQYCFNSTVLDNNILEKGFFEDAMMLKKWLSGVKVWRGTTAAGKWLDRDVVNTMGRWNGVVIIEKRGDNPGYAALWENGEMIDGKIKNGDTVCFWGLEKNVRLFIKTVKGDTEALLRQMITYEVTEYHTDNDSIYKGHVSDSIKRRIKWAVMVGGKVIDEHIGESGEKVTGEKVTIKIKEEWVGHVINVMASLEEFKRKVSQKTVVNVCKHKNGAISIAEYIVQEIKNNTKSDVANQIRRGHYPNIFLWKNMVGDKKPWDHKVPIRTNFAEFSVVSHDKEKGRYHEYNGHNYYYDVWSNIHFGYVGLSVGFSEDTLLFGADVAQVVSSRGKYLKDTEDDKTSIKIGFALYKKYGQYAENLTANAVLEALETASYTTKTRTVHEC